jgi:hypothetical protein
VKIEEKVRRMFHDSQPPSRKKKTIAERPKIAKSDGGFYINPLYMEMPNAVI